MAYFPRRPLWSAQKSYTKQQTPDASYPDTADSELTDILLADSALASSGWVGWKNESSVQVDLDLGQPRPIGFGQAWLLRRDADGLIQCDTVALYGSNDASSWTPLGSAAPALADNTAGWVEVTATVLGEYRYVRFQVEIDLSAAGDEYVFIGELQVYGYEFGLPAFQSGTTDAGGNLEMLYHLNQPNAADSEPDSSGNSRTLTAVNSPPAATGVFDGGRTSVYDGTARRLRNISTGTIAWGTALTFMCWLNPQSMPSALAYRYAVSFYNNLHWIGWRMGGAGENATWWVKLNNAAAAEILTQTLHGAIPTATWFHLCATYDGSFLRLYVNGNLAGVKAYTTAVGSTYRIFVGGDNSGYYLPDSTVDEVLCFTRCLSEAEIRWHVASRRGSVA